MITFNFRPNPSQLDSLLSDHTWRVKLFAPAIVSSNGGIDPQTGATAWELPLQEIYKLEEAKSLTATLPDYGQHAFQTLVSICSWNCCILWCFAGGYPPSRADCIFWIIPKP